jgi:hypothetical protein
MACVDLELYRQLRCESVAFARDLINPTYHVHSSNTFSIDAARFVGVDFLPILKLKLGEKR